MKRFTETEKWRDPWFQKLDKESRTLWQWLCDRVDNAGVVDICWPICNAETMGNHSDESMLAFGDRVEKLETGKWWIPKFTLFQFGELSDSQTNKVHQSVIKLLNRYSLSHRVCHRVYDTPKDKDKDKDKVKEKVMEYIIEGQILNHLNEKTGKNFRAVKANLQLVHSRIAEGFTPETLKGIVDVKCSQWLHKPEWAVYLRPETLFGAKKCASYAGEVGAKVPVDPKSVNGF